MTELLLLIVVGTSIWVALDAGQRDWSQSPVAKGALGWFLLTLLLWIIFFPVYLSYRGQAPRKRGSAPPVSPAPAGWYPSASDPAQQRYWNGQQWTEHFWPGEESRIFGTPPG